MKPNTTIVKLNQRGVESPFVSMSNSEQQQKRRQERREADTKRAQEARARRKRAVCLAAVEAVLVLGIFGAWSLLLVHLL